MWIQEKSGGCLYGQKGTKDITHILAVPGPVGAKLKFQSDAGDNA